MPGWSGSALEQEKAQLPLPSHKIVFENGENADTREISLSAFCRNWGCDLIASILFHRLVHLFNISGHGFRCQDCLLVT